MNVRGTTVKSNVLYGPNNPGDGEYPDFGSNVDNNGYPLVIKSRNNKVDSANCMIFGNADIYAVKKSGSTYVPNDLCLQHRSGMTGAVRIGSKLIVSDVYPGGLEVKDSADILYDLRFGSTNSANLIHDIGVIGQSGTAYGHTGTTINIFSENLNVLTGSNKNTIVFGQHSGATSTTITAIGSVGIDTAYDYQLAAGQKSTIADYVNASEGNLICGAKKNLKLNPGDGRYLSVYNRRSLQGAYQKGTTTSQEYTSESFYINPYGGQVIIGNTKYTGGTGRVTINPDVEIKNILTGTTGNFTGGVYANSILAKNARIEGSKYGRWMDVKDKATVFNPLKPVKGYSPVVAVQGQSGIFSLGTVEENFYIAHQLDKDLSGVTGATNSPSGTVRITPEGRLLAKKLHSTEEALGSVAGVSDVVLGCPIGTIVMWPTTSAPKGWLSCNGSRIPCTKTGSTYTAKTGYEKYQKLIDVLGAQDNTNSGGKGGTRLFSTATSSGTLQTIDGSWLTKGDTFICIPDFKFRFPFGTNANLDSGDNPGIFKTGGTTHHKHTISDNVSVASGDYNLTSSGTHFEGRVIVSNTKDEAPTFTVDSVSNMPPYIAINFIIKYQ